MRVIALVALLILCGCQTQKQISRWSPIPAPLPPLPQTPVLRQKSLTAQPAKDLTPGVVRFIPILYPADASNFLWRIEGSTNLIDWTVLMKNCKGTPSTNSDIWVTNSGTGQYFVRPVEQTGPE